MKETVFSVVKKNGWTFLVGPAFKMIEAVFDLLIPLVMKAVLDLSFSSDPSSVDTVSRAFGDFLRLFGTWVEGNDPLNYALIGGTLILLMGIVGLATTMVCQYIAALSATRTGTDLRDRLYRKILSLGKKEREGFGEGKLMTVLNSDSFQVQQGVLFFIRLGVRAPFIILGSLVLSLVLNWPIGLVFLAIIPIILLIVFLVMRRASRQYLVIQGRLDQLSVATSDSLEGARVIRAFSTMEEERKKFAARTSTYQDESIRVSRINALINPLTFAIVSLATILVVFLGSFDMASGVEMMGQKVLPSTILTLVSYLSQIFQTLILLTNLVTIFTKTIVSWKRCNSLLALSPAIADSPKGLVRSIGENQDLFALSDVSFAYEEGGNKALQDVSFTLRKGESLGIIGGTGSGKTTLIRLLERLLDPTEGTILYKGVDLRDYSLKALRREIAFVPQKSILFKGTIRSNMQMAKEDVTDEEILRCLSVSCARDFVESYPDRLDHEVEEGGKNFSGGQRQRLAMARTFLRRPEVLILDDSTSALDLLTDKRVRDNLRDFLPGATKVFISQRVSTIKDCDLILVLEGGKVLAMGDHASLLRTSEVYRETYESQMQKEALE